MSQAYILTCKDGKRIALQMSSPDKFWKGLAAVIESARSSAALSQTANAVFDSYEAIGSELAAIFATRPREEWLERLAQHDVPFAPERRLNELDEDPQVRHLDLFYELDHPAAGAVRSVHRAISGDGSREIDFRPPPTLGEHTREVLAGLGLSDDELRGLSSQGVIKMQT